MNEVVKTPRAVEDLIDLAAYLYSTDPASDVSERFLKAADRAFIQLAQNPGMGAAYRSEFGIARSLCRWSVPGFRSYLIFYSPTAAGVEIVRVLHGSRDITAALGESDPD